MFPEPYDYAREKYEASRDYMPEPKTDWNYADEMPSNEETEENEKDENENQ